MPAALIQSIADAYRKRKAKGKLKGVSMGQYIYGGFNNRGWMRGNKETGKGKKVFAKYEEDHSGN